MKIWPDFVPVEYRGISIISAMLFFFTFSWILNIKGRLDCTKKTSENLYKVINKIDKLLVKLETLNTEQQKDITEIKESIHTLANK